MAHDLAKCRRRRIRNASRLVRSQFEVSRVGAIGREFKFEVLGEEGLICRVPSFVCLNSFRDLEKGVLIECNCFGFFDRCKR